MGAVTKDGELITLHRIVKLLEEMDEQERGRALAYLWARYWSAKAKVPEKEAP